MDHRLLQLLRFAREGTFVYGEPATDEAMRNIEGVAGRLGVSASEIDPFCVQKIPCYVAHGKEINSGSCQVNLVRRWFKAFGQSLGIYLPVFVVPALLFRRRKLVRDPAGELAHILQGAGRSSAFLATFVGLTWYGVCLGRTVLFPRLLPSVGTNFWESGFQCQLGSFLCGFSLLLESKRRRGEMALYVAPRALYALMDEVLPESWLDEDHAWFSTWSERFLFASSMGVLTSAVRRFPSSSALSFLRADVDRAQTVHRPDLVRGVAKGIMQYSVGPEWRGNDNKQTT